MAKPIHEIPITFSPSQSGSVAETSSRADLSLWLSSLLARLELARGIAVPDDRFLWLLEELKRDGYRVEDRGRAAELWILKGSGKWQYGRPILELSDFYPDARSVEHLLEDGEIIVRPSRIAQERRNAVEGYRDTARRLKMQQERSETAKRDIEDAIENAKTILRLTDELKTARDRIAELESQITQEGAKA